ncbi:hypothetical protein TNCT_647571 [Trichonephila clavata]|uniref:Uncharacterized protein n=1 Tax=Trichonephila clavata TaxID=2740835 RepID=A0A8X6JN31_TRICU|nr:hypothetical protein TNCT_647571 [Trichonephila clavata]
MKSFRRRHERDANEDLRYIHVVVSNRCTPECRNVASVPTPRDCSTGMKRHIFEGSTIIHLNGENSTQSKMLWKEASHAEDQTCLHSI